MPRLDRAAFPSDNRWTSSSVGRHTALFFLVVFVEGVGSMSMASKEDDVVGELLRLH